MYGTVSRMRIKPGTEERFQQFSKEFEEANIPGYLFEVVHRSDADPLEITIVVGFESKEAYLANANDPAQNERYLEYLECLDGEPSWNDGEIIRLYRK